MPLCILSFAKVTEILEKQNSLSENFTGSSEEIDIRPTAYVSRFGCPSDIGFLPPLYPKIRRKLTKPMK